MASKYEHVSTGNGYHVKNGATKTKIINQDGTPVLASGLVVVGDSTGKGQPVALSGDATVSNTGVVTLAQTHIKYATVTLTAAEILALFTTAKTLVAAPGANKAIEVISATISYLYGATAYTVASSTNLSIKYKDKTGADTTSTRATTGLIDQVTNQFSLLRPLAATLALDANAVNQPICLALVGGNPTLGDGTFKVNVTYRVHTLV